MFVKILFFLCVLVGMFVVLSLLLRLATVITSNDYEGSINQIFCLSLISLLGSLLIIDSQLTVFQLTVSIALLFFIAVIHLLLNNKIFS